jgi:hypothetical protein
MHVQVRQKVLGTRVEAHLRETARSLEAGPVRWFVPRFLSASILGVGLTVVVPAFLSGDLAQALDSSARFYWVRVLTPVVLAAPFTYVGYRRARKQVRAGTAALARRLETEWRELTEPGWVGRACRYGGYMTAGIGIPVGLLMALPFPTSELPGGSRLLALAGFVAATAAWAFPMAFGFRWLSIKSHKKFLAAPD